MGVSIKYVGDRRRMAVLRRAIWSVIENGLPGELDIDAASDAVSQLCKAVSTVAEDMKNVSELNRIGYMKRHWYVLELNISDSSVEMQNILDGAGQCPHSSHQHSATFTRIFAHINAFLQASSCPAYKT